MRYLSFLHEDGDNTVPQVKIYGLPDGADVGEDVTDACYSVGGQLLGTLGTDAITGLNITNLVIDSPTGDANPLARETSFNFSFDADINTNTDLYTATVGYNSIAIIHFCVVLFLPL
jgi:hypothetical protein